MCELEKWMKRNKRLCVATGIFGLLTAPFLWPFFMAIIFQSLLFAMPFVAAWLLVKQPWKEKEEQNDDPPQSREEKGQKSVDEQEGGMQKDEPDEESCLVLLWYQEEGRERILRMKEKLDKEGKKEFSISRDGICSVRKEKGFQRIGVLRGYPGSKILSVEKELKKDGLSIKSSGDYVWISWKNGGMKYAL